MSATLVTAIAFASSGMLSPGSILLTLLILSSPDGPKRALAYYAGYFGSYTTLGVTIVLVNGRLRTADASADEPSVVVGWVSLAIGLLMLFFAVRAWRAPRDGPPRRPKIFDTIDTMPARKLLGLGALVSVINVKNLSLFLSAITVVVEGNLPAPQAVVVAVATVFVFCLAVLIPILVFVIGRTRAESLLLRLRRTIDSNSRRIVLTVLPLFACLMLGRGLFRLLG